MVTSEFLITSLIVVLIPGTGALYTISTGIFLGNRASLFAAFGCTLGIIPALLASILGLAVLFHTSALAFQIVKYLGVVYLLYLAWSMWSSNSTLSVNSENRKTLLSIAFKAFLINILNPKLSIFFLAFLPQFISPSASQATFEMILLGSIFMGMTFIIFAIYGLLAHKARTFIVNSEKRSLFMNKLFASCFAGLGLKLAFTDRT